MWDDTPFDFAQGRLCPSPLMLVLMLNDGLGQHLTVLIRCSHDRTNKCFYEKVIKVKADVASVLNFFRTNQVLLETPADATHRSRASIRTLMGRFWARRMLGFDPKPRSITIVTDLGLLGLPSMARS
jgi:hypothetical protein